MLETRLLSSKAALGSYVNHTQRDARLCISIRPTLLFFFKHMHWIISHHILQSGACQCGVAMTTSSVPPPHPPYTHTLHHYPHHSPPSQATTTPPPLWLQTGQRKIKRGKKNTLLGETKMVGLWRKGKERRCCVHDWNSSLCLAWLFCSLGVLGVAGNFSCLSGVDCVCVCSFCYHCTIYEQHDWELTV